tara:strand:- start:60 stop:761 length:702 start_codon:yes stop_codon:yes gene_type:complete
MIVIILAAGRGTRLGKPFPKTLTNLKDGKSILLHQLDGLYKYIRRDNIFVVVGYKKELIKQVFPDLHYINNDRYNVTNTSQSLLIALNQFPKKDILWLNGDIVYDHRVIKRLISTPNSCMAVNSAKVGDEEVKYKTNKSRYVIEISKEVKKPEGESVGIHKIPANEVPILIKYLSVCKDQDYFEKGLEMAIQNGLKVTPIDISDLNCIEIDFPEDLDAANNMIDDKGIIKDLR